MKGEHKRRLRKLERNIEMMIERRLLDAQRINELSRRLEALEDAQTPVRSTFNWIFRNGRN